MARPTLVTPRIELGGAPGVVWPTLDRRNNMVSKHIAFAMLAGFGALALMPTGAAALNGGGGSGGSDYGDSYLNDAQKNPRFIQPYSDNDPARYRISNGQYGYDDRQRAARGYADEDYRPRGRVVVRPYSVYRN